jgi:hypothetical protein
MNIKKKIIHDLFKKLCIIVDCLFYADFCNLSFLSIVSVENYYE